MREQGDSRLAGGKIQAGWSAEGRLNSIFLGQEPAVKQWPQPPHPRPLSHKGRGEDDRPRRLLEFTLQRVPRLNSRFGLRATYLLSGGGASPRGRGSSGGGASPGGGGCRPAAPPRSPNRGGRDTSLSLIFTGNAIIVCPSGIFIV